MPVFLHGRIKINLRIEKFQSDRRDIKALKTGKAEIHFSPPNSSENKTKTSKTVYL